MGWESSDVVRFDDSLALVSCLCGGYKFAVLRCVGLVLLML